MDYKEGCGCGVIDVTSITVTEGTAFVLNVTPRTLYDGRRYTLRLCQCLPVPNETGIEPVTISDGTNTYPVLDEIGNLLLSGRLRGRRNYRIVFGDNDAHFLLYGAECCLNYYPNGAVVTG